MFVSFLPARVPMVVTMCVFDPSPVEGGGHMVPGPTTPVWGPGQASQGFTWASHGSVVVRVASLFKKEGIIRFGPP